MYVRRPQRPCSCCAPRTAPDGRQHRRRAIFSFLFVVVHTLAPKHGKIHHDPTPLIYTSSPLSYLADYENDCHEDVLAFARPWVIEQAKQNKKRFGGRKQAQQLHHIIATRNKNDEELQVLSSGR